MLDACIDKDVKCRMHGRVMRVVRRCGEVFRVCGEEKGARCGEAWVACRSDNGKWLCFENMMPGVEIV